MEYKMRKSKVLEKLRSGEVVTCFKLNLSGGEVAEIAALAGFDCIWVDREHVVQDWSDIKAQNWAVKAFDADLMVRVSRGSYSELIKPFELDSAGILVPHVMNLQDAKNIVRFTRFSPIGRRPIDGGNSDGAYGNIDFQDYLEQANEQRFVALQIEDPEPLDELDEIAALEGYDMLFFGPGDFSQGIGTPGDFNNPLLIETRRRVAEAARRHGKFAATVGSPGNAAELIEMGYHFISMGADVVGLSSYCKNIMNDFNNINEAKKQTGIYL